MAQFAYNNAKTASTGYILFELNCSHHSRILYKEKVDPDSKSKSADELSADKLSAELRELMIVCQDNLHHTHELQKQAYNKGIKPRNYTPDDKVWLNSKYIMTKRKRKLKVKLFEPFQVLHPIKKQAYKLELPRKWKIRNVFHETLLEQDTTRKGHVDEEVRQIEFDADDDNSREYKVEAIQDSTVYAKESESGYLPGFHYLIS